MDERDYCPLSVEDEEEGWEMKYGSGHAAEPKACPRDAAGSASYSDNER